MLNLTSSNTQETVNFTPPRYKKFKKKPESANVHISKKPHFEIPPLCANFYHLGKILPLYEVLRGNNFEQGGITKKIVDKSCQSSFDIRNDRQILVLT